jgi:hypothetical protein
LIFLRGLLAAFLAELGSRALWPLIGADIPSFGLIDWCGQVADATRAVANLIRAGVMAADRQQAYRMRMRAGCRGLVRPPPRVPH